jgi:hypothetical protein
MRQGVGALEALVVNRATLAYHQIEDRISLTCAVNKDECVVLWLTARLASQLVPHLCQAVAQLPDVTPGDGDQEGVDNEALPDEPASDAASESGSAQGPAPEVPVVAGADSVAWLVTAIDLTNGPMLVQLGFRDDQGHPPLLFSLEHTQLAQWSEGLKSCYAQAGWSMECWHMPAGAGSQIDATQRVALH